MTPRNPSFAEEIKASFAKQTIMGLIGAELSRVEPGVVEITLPYRADLAQQHGYLARGHSGDYCRFGVRLCSVQLDASKVGSFKCRVQS